MKVQLTHKESEDIFHTALCDSLGYTCGYGLELEYEAKAYQEAKSKLESPCYEDILLQLLKDGGTLTLVDIENDGDMTSTINIQDVHERVQNAPIQNIIDIQEGEGDAITADNILQTVFFSEIVFA